MTYEQALAYCERVIGHEGYNSEDSHEVYDKQCLKIAKLLREMRAENKRLREALELADGALSGANMNLRVVEKKVRAALAEPDAPHD